MLKEIPSHKNYMISESGVIVDSNNNLVRTAVDKYGYMYTFLDNKKEYIHDLVGETFLTYNSSHRYGNYIVHLDDDTLNNHVTNLKWSKFPENKYSNEVTDNFRTHRSYSNSPYLYEVYNGRDSVICKGRGELADTIQYEEISLKNMVGNGRKITLGPYAGYMIRRI